MCNSLSHLAIVLDGNGRWATLRDLPRRDGHNQGRLVLCKIIEATCRLKIPYLTLFTSSPKNLQRKPQESNNLVQLIKDFVKIDLKELEKLPCRIRPMGEFDLLNDKELAEELNRLREADIEADKPLINLAIAYSGSYDIAQSIISSYRKNNLSILEDRHSICNEIFHHSYLFPSPPVDLCIRPGKEKRLSDFCIWHLSYAELAFSDTLWPDFTEKELLEIIQEYQKRDRRFGKEG